MYQNSIIITHPLEPIFDKNSKILILGSFPSRISRKESFYYGNKNNRFWKILAQIFNKPSPNTNSQKLELLSHHNIAIFDVVKSCQIEASSDSSIKNAIPNDIKNIVANSDIKAIFLNGKTAQKLFEKFFKDVCFINLNHEKPLIFTLPSTSPANAKFYLTALIDEWRVIKIFS